MYLQNKHVVYVYTPPQHIEILLNNITYFKVFKHSDSINKSTRYSEYDSDTNGGRLPPLHLSQFLYVSKHCYLA